MKKSTKKNRSKILSYLQTLAEGMPGSFYWKDKEGYYLGGNETIFRTTSLSPEELIGKTDALLWPTQADDIRKHDFQVMRSGNPLHLEEVVIIHGKLRYFTVVKIPLRDETGDIIGIIGNSIDITPQKELEKELEKAKKQTDLYLKNILDSIPGSIYWKDREGKYLGCNHVAVKMANCQSVDEIVGKNDYEIFDGIVDKTHIDKIIENDQQVMQVGETLIFEESWIADNGQPVTALSTKIPLKDEKGNIIGVMGNSVDITQRKADEEERLDTLRALGGSIAHELRTPLGGMQSALNGIQRYLPDFMDAYRAAKEAKLKIASIPREHFNIIAESLEKGFTELDYARMMVDMLLANINQGQIRTDNFKIYSMSHCIEQAITRYPSLSADEKAMLDWKNDNDFQFFGEKMLMVHILFNLLKNAFYFIGRCKRDNKKISLWIDYTEQDNVLHFKDTGLGVPANILPHLFDRFFTTTSNGTGLGLAFCKMVMIAFNGSIECESKEGEFTEFILRFPKILDEK
jgi:PAS domain S-box-containing protein